MMHRGKAGSVPGGAGRICTAGTGRAGAINRFNMSWTVDTHNTGREEMMVLSGNSGDAADTAAGDPLYPPGIRPGDIFLRCAARTRGRPA